MCPPAAPGPPRVGEAAQLQRAALGPGNPIGRGESAESPNAEDFVGQANTERGTWLWLSLSLVLRVFLGKTRKRRPNIAKNGWKKKHKLWGGGGGGNTTGVVPFLRVPFFRVRLKGKKKLNHFKGSRASFLGVTRLGESGTTPPWLK